MFDLSKCTPLQNWVENNPKITSMLSFEEVSSSFSIFGSSKRSLKSMYTKYITQLNNLLNLISKEKSNAIDSIAKVSGNPVMKVGKLCFEKDEQNLCLRKIAFSYRLIQELQITLANSKLSLFLDKEEDSKKMIELFKSSIIPSNCFVRIDENFFLLSYPQEWAQLSFRIDSLTCYLKNMDELVSKFEIPLWATDFPKYFDNLVNDNFSKFDSSICYLPQLDSEVYVSRAIFGGFCNLDIKIDTIANNLTKFPANEYIKYVLDEAMRLSPTQNIQKTSEQQSIELLIFFRIIFDRIYEKHSNELLNNSSDLQKKIEEMSKLSISLFYQPENQVSPFFANREESIRDVFLSDSCFKSAKQFFDTIEFIINPIDMLYPVHKALLSINKGALVRRLNGNEASLDDLNTLLCFDDLFVLMLGVLMAADVPEFSAIANFVRNYSPSFCLSNSFEYSQAGIESLLVHIETLDLDKFKNRAK